MASPYSGDLILNTFVIQSPFVILNGAGGEVKDLERMNDPVILNEVKDLERMNDLSS